MSALAIAGIALLGGLGSIARFLLDGAIASRLATSFPAGTLVVNLSGALVLGILAGLTSDSDTLDLAATGLLGSFTTFSTWAFESHRLGEDGELHVGALNFALSLAAGLLAVWAGRRVGIAL